MRIIKRILISLLTLIVVISCNLNKTSKNDNIDSDTKSQIHRLNYKIIDGFIENNPDKVLDVCSEVLIKKSKNEIANLIHQVSQNFSKDNFKILNEFYQKNSSKNVQTKVITGISGNHDYIIRFKALNSEMYVSVGYFDNDINQTCITTIYGKYGNEWKLNILQVGTLRIMNKDAFDWYNEAKSKYEKGYLIDAANDITISNQLLKPANQFWKYQKENEIKEFGKKIMTDINSKFTFPITIDYVNSKPQIFRIYPQGAKEGIFPMVLYKTKIDIKDTLRLSEECNSIHNNIGKIFKGINKDNKLIFYRAFKSFPTGNESVEYYGFVKENE